MLTIADRRAVMNAAMREPDFRDLLKRDPRGAITRAAHRGVPEDMRITVLEEQSDAWEFVIPAQTIDARLPEAEDVRSTVENDVYALLRDEPSIRAQIVDQPKTVLEGRLRVFVGNDRVNVHEERPGDLILILPHVEAREELTEDALDLVAGGGDSGCTNGRLAHKYGEGDDY